MPLITITTTVLTNAVYHVVIAVGYDTNCQVTIHVTT